MAGGLDLPIIPLQQTFKANTVTPKDLTGLISAFGDDYFSSAKKAGDLENQRLIGNSGANKTAMQNKAAAAQASGDVVDELGRPIPKKPTGAAPASTGGVDLKSYTTPELLNLLNQTGSVPPAQV